MSIILKNSWNVPPARWGSFAEVQYAVRVNAEKIYGVNPDLYQLNLPFFWGLPVVDYSNNQNSIINYNVKYRNNALLYDGNTDYLKVLHNSSLDIGTNFTVTARLSPTVLGNRMLFRKFVSGTEDKHILLLSDAGLLKVRTLLFNIGATVASTSGLSLNSANNIAVTYDNVNVCIYIKGREDAIAARTGNVVDSNGHLYIGKNPDNAAQDFDGSMETMDWYCGTYTAQQVALFNDLPYYLYRRIVRPFYLLPIADVTTTTPTTVPPTTLLSTTLAPTTISPTTVAPATTSVPTTPIYTTVAPTTEFIATTPLSTTLTPTTLLLTTLAPTTLAPTTLTPTTLVVTTLAPTSLIPTTLVPTTLVVTTLAPTTLLPTTLAPTSLAPTSLAPTTVTPTTVLPTTLAPTSLAPTTLAPTSLAPTTLVQTTLQPTTLAPTTLLPTTIAPTSLAPTTITSTTLTPTTILPTTLAPTTLVSTTLEPTTLAPTTVTPTSLAPTTLAPTTLGPTTLPPTTLLPTTDIPEIICIKNFKSTITNEFIIKSSINKELRIHGNLC